MDINLLRDIEKTTMESLKDFQCATVERVDALFRSGQNRVLVADEVGLGKTLIARGVISKTSIIQCEADDDLFKILFAAFEHNAVCLQLLYIHGFVDIADLYIVHGNAALLDRPASVGTGRNKTGFYKKGDDIEKTARVIIAEHKDLNDKGQTVKIVGVPGHSPKTGDPAHIVWAIALLLLSGEAAYVVYRVRRSREDKDEPPAEE